jgi:hypothetical protein
MAGAAAMVGVLFSILNIASCSISFSLNCSQLLQFVPYLLDVDTVLAGRCLAVRNLLSQHLQASKRAFMYCSMFCRQPIISAGTSRIVMLESPSICALSGLTSMRCFKEPFFTFIVDLRGTEKTLPPRATHCPRPSAAPLGGYRNSQKLKEALGT